MILTGKNVELRRRWMAASIRIAKAEVAAETTDDPAIHQEQLNIIATAMHERQALEAQDKKESKS